ncbi:MULTISPECIES: hypothetical protein [Oscillatoriales]|uniref:Uncharacterized protein n=1 Tax=Phormidium nigroviride PCC 7112 TaxID=179408 RepID=K9VRA5_9CYAN|nr:MULTISPECIES: hypothetical protein [Oscillatoriales]AFZ10491.1 hypothetical protein Osc7112_6330 [Oscillatoria nigro-viridis PCC 7112]MBE9093273.1 hypothetical protein [Tychonema sp. LEGE 07203]
MNDEAVIFLNNLLQQEPSRVQSWLNSVWEDRQQVPINFNWLGLAETAAFKASDLASKSEEYRQSSLIWAQIAVLVYNFLARNRSNGAIRESLIESLMNLRLYMILQLGARVDDPVLDPALIISCFFENLEFSYEDTLAKASVWKKLFRDNIPEAISQKLESDMEELRSLKKLKLRLGIIKTLLENNRIAPNQVLQAWVSIWENLP